MGLNPGFGIGPIEGGAFGALGGGGKSKPWWQQLFGMGEDFLSSQLGQFFVNQAAANEQRKLDERARGQQEALVGQSLGMFGLGGIPGVDAVPPPPGMDLSALPGQAQTLADQLGGLSSGNLARTQTGLGGLGRISAGLQALPGQFTRQNRNILGEFRQQGQNITGQFGAGAGDINRGFRDRLGEALGMLEGRGAQAEEDIATRFRESLGEQQANLRARGFGGSDIANIARASAGEESAEQRRLQEQLRGERLGLFSDLSGQGLAAQERLLGAGTGLQAGFAGQQLGAGQAGQQFLGGLNLNALGQRGQLGQFMQDALMQSRQQDLSNQFQFGQFPIGVQQQGIGQALQMLGSLDIRAPQQMDFSLF